MDEIEDIVDQLPTDEVWVQFFCQTESDRIG